jgi:MtaA/CmuA family methyltransferase
MQPSMRDDILGLLGGQRPARPPVFSGLPSLTAAGLAQAGVSYSSAHTDAGRMAAAAASTFHAFGFPAAAVPFDLCVEAEALGAGVDFQTDAAGFVAPIVSQVLPADLMPDGLAERVARALPGRVPLVAEALRRLRGAVGGEAVIAGVIPGPFTLGWQAFGAETWLLALARPGVVPACLEHLTELLLAVAEAYRAAGADFITIHEMGGSPQVVGPRVFRRVIQPALARLVARLKSPAVLSVCGNSNAVIEDLAACGAEALSVDHRNDLARTRAILGPDVLLFGNLDPVGVLAQGTPDQVAAAARAAAAAGADAIWPGCDLWPEVPAANVRAWMGAMGE